MLPVAIGLIAAGVGAVSLLSAYNSSKASEANAEVSLRYAQYNSDNILAASQFNADIISSIASVNADAILQAASVSSAVNEETARYNATLALMASQYDAELLESEAALIWRELQLDKKQLEIEYNAVRGSVEASQAASGTVMGEGSNLDIIISDQTMYQLNVMAAEHEADVQASRIMNSRALSLWEGEAEASSILFSSRMNSLGAMANAEISAAATIAQGSLNAAATRYNGVIDSLTALYGGSVQSWQYSNQAQLQLTNGIYSAASSAVTTYGMFSSSSLSSSGSTGTAGTSLTSSFASGIAPTRVGNYSAGISLLD